MDLELYNYIDILLHDYRKGMLTEKHLTAQNKA